MFRPKLLILEGVDKTGKSTIYQAFRRATSYQVLVIDRWIGSQIAYDAVWARPNVPSQDQWWEVEVAQQRVFDCYLALLTAAPSVLEARIKLSESGKDLDIALMTYQKTDALFRDYFNHSSIRNRKVLDTGEYDVPTCVAHLVELVREPIPVSTSQWEPK